MGLGCPRAPNHLGVPAEGGQISPHHCLTSLGGSGRCYGKGWSPKNPTQSPKTPLGPFAHHHNQVIKVGPPHIAPGGSAEHLDPKTLKVTETLKVRPKKTLKARETLKTRPRETLKVKTRETLKVRARVGQEENITVVVPLVQLLLRVSAGLLS